MRLSRKALEPKVSDLQVTTLPETSSAFNTMDFTVDASVSVDDRAPPSAVIGAKIVLKGILSGSEDLLIEGRLEGRVELTEHSVTIGTKGVVNADTKAKCVTVEGRVKGNVEARELISVASTSSIEGNLNAQRVNLEDGAKFRGAIDMSGKH